MNKLISLLLTIVMLCGLAGMSLADTDEFDFHVTPPNEVFSGTVRKADNEQRFYVTTDSINLKSGDAFWYGPRLGATVMSSGLRITRSSNPRQSYSYSKTAEPNKYYRLRGNSRLQDITSGSVYQIDASGRWTP